MPTSRTAEEVKVHHIEVMGEDLGSLYHALWNELAVLHSKWDEYLVIFGTKPSRVDLVNRAASYFFSVVQESLWEGTLLHIARLSDPARTGRKSNLSVMALPDLIEDTSLKEDICKLIAVAEGQVTFCRDWRNRRLAHRDLHLALQQGAAPLEKASRAQVKAALLALSDIMNAISVHYMDSTTMYEGLGNHEGAEALIYVIDDGLRVKEERKDRRQKGVYREDDSKRRDL
jgi:hypothetical protein